MNESGMNTVVTLDMLRQAAAYAPWITAETGPAMIEHSDDPEFWRGKAAVYAPWVTAEIGTDLIEHSDDPRYWREKAAAHARWAQPNMEKDK